MECLRQPAQEPASSINRPMPTVRRIVLALLLLVLILLATGCGTQKLGYAPARITVRGTKVHIQVKQKLRPLPDTVIDAIIIKRIR